MHFQFDIASGAPNHAEPTPDALAGSETVSLLRQLLEVQRENLNCIRATQDAGSRWRAFLARWREDFPDLHESCRDAMPILERSYGALIAELSEHLREHGTNALDNDFSLQEFLDRYGMRLAQLGTILNLVAPLAEASSQGESS